MAESYEKYGCSPAAALDRAGGFDVPCIAAHGLWLEEDDYKFFRADTYLAACPKTYLKLGMGRGTLWDRWARANLCIGPDGAASSNTLDALEQARLLALLGKWEDRAEDFTLREVWRTLMRGHDALGFGAGDLRLGAAADLNIWDLDTPSTAPLYNPLAAILYSADHTNIRHTLVDGRFVKRDGALLLDTHAILAEASRCAAAIGRRGKGESKLYF